MDEENRREPAADEPCPCGSGLVYGECCGRQAETAPAAEDAEPEAGSADD